MDFNEILSFFGDRLPLLELCSVFINLALVFLFLFTLSARQILVCVRRGRDSLSKEDTVNVVSLERKVNDVSFGTVFKLSLICCVYVLGVQVLVSVFDGVSVVREASSDWFVLCFPSAQGLAWVVISFLALHLKYKPSEKLPFLLRIWWFLAFSVCLCTLYVDGRRLAVEGWSGCSSHVVANLAVTPALGFLCFVALRGVSGIEIRRSDSDLQEPLLVEEEAACLKVTPYSSAGLVSLVTLSWLELQGVEVELEEVQVGESFTASFFSTCHSEIVLERSSLQCRLRWVEYSLVLRGALHD